MDTFIHIVDIHVYAETEIYRLNSIEYGVKIASLIDISLVKYVSLSGGEISSVYI